MEEPNAFRCIQLLFRHNEYNELNWKKILTRAGIELGKTAYKVIALYNNAIHYLNGAAVLYAVVPGTSFGPG